MTDGAGPTVPRGLSGKSAAVLRPAGASRPLPTAVPPTLCLSSTAGSSLSRCRLGKFDRCPTKGSGADKGSSRSS